MDFSSIKLDEMSYDEELDIQSEEMIEQDIAIIGLSFKLPQADTKETFLNNLRHGVDSVREIPVARKKDTDLYFKHRNQDVNKVQYGEAAYLDEVDQFDYSFFKLSPKEASLMDPNQRIFLQTAWNALEDAGYTEEQLNGSRTAVYLGYGSDSDYKNMIHQMEPDAVSLSMPGNVKPIIASRLSYILNLKGSSLTVDTTCSSSLVAVHLACQAILNGECDMAVTGGIQLHLVPVRDFEVGVESSTSRTRAFDDSSDGTGTGEGTVVMVLKKLNQALEDRDHIYAVIKSSAMNQDGSSVGITAPNAEAQTNVIMEAWEKGGIDPESISYIEAHGTGTKLGDPIEIQGIQSAFRQYTDKKQFCAISSIKSNIGHLDSTAGITGLLKAVLSLKMKELFPTLHFNRPNRQISFESSPVYILDRWSKWEVGNNEVRRCGVSSFGISGTNCHVVLEEAPEMGTEIQSDLDDKTEIFVLSAKTKYSLNLLITNYIQFLKNNKQIYIRDVSYTLCMARNHYSERIALIVRDIEDLIEQLSALDLGLSKAPFDSSLNKSELHQLLEHTLDYQPTKKEEFSLREIAKMYIDGKDIPWSKLFYEKRNKISLPTYPFELQRCWFNFPKEDEYHHENVYYQTIWEKAPLIIKKEVSPINRTYLVLKDKMGLGDQICEKLKNKGHQVIEVDIGAQFNCENGSSYTIKATLEEDYVKLLQQLKTVNITHILHMVSISETKKNSNLCQLETKLNNGVYSLFYLTKALVKNQMFNPIEILTISKFANDVNKEQQTVIPENTALFGLGKIIGWEYKNVKVRCIDIDQHTKVKSLVNELLTHSNEYKVAYRSQERYVERLDVLKLPKEVEKSITLKTTGVYIISGGLGGIGLNIAKHLAIKENVNIAMLQRSRLPERDLWEAILKENTNKKLCAKLRGIQEIESTGSKVICFDVDVSNERALKNTIENLKQQFNNINGVIHAAGIGEGNLLGELTKQQFTRVIESKVHGTVLLDQLLVEEQLDFFILFSSAITLVGGVGSGPYNVANTYLDGYASYRNLNNLGHTMVINWPSWQNTGLAEGDDIEEDKELFKVLSVNQGLSIFDRLLNEKIKQVYIGDLNVGSKLYQLGDVLPFKCTPELLEKLNIEDKINVIEIESKLQPCHPSLKLKGKEENHYTEIEKKIAGIWVQILGYEELDVNDNFFEIGGDSILITKVHALVEQSFQIQVTVADLFSYPTIAKLSEYMMSLKGQSCEVSGAEFSLDEDILSLFSQIETGKLTIEDAVSEFRTLEVYNGKFISKNI
ncbi:type I polyketide synthase [Chengkuizengella marina]|uniref:type I polyketide synthase n=1 Tax=Chengkuizengella marina TaxID=2507566 RepID=UPI00136E7839|nr:type I polyketide synthase [Chengkuizengella marina]